MWRCRLFDYIYIYIYVCVCVCVCVCAIKKLRDSVITGIKRSNVWSYHIRCPGYDPTPSDGKAPLLELRGM